MSEPFLSRFSDIWEGGYFEGDPLDPMTASSYGIFGYYSCLYVVYLCCIKPFITSHTVVLEIGPGRGAWTKAIAGCNPAHIYAVDVVSPEHSGFWEYVPRLPSIEYIQATDFSLDKIPDGSIEYFFSYGCFCHLRPDMCVAYIDSIAKKMKEGAHGFLMVADFRKYAMCIENYAATSIASSFIGKKFVLVRLAYRLSTFLARAKFIGPLPGSRPDGWGWYDLGTERACDALKKNGFSIVESDMNINHRDPIIHFVNPLYA
jgi:hypothetical protein